MVRTTIVLVSLVALVSAGQAASSSSTPSSVNRGRGSRRAFVSRPRSRGSPTPPTQAPTFASTASFAPTQRQSVTPSFAPTISQSVTPSFSPGHHEHHHQTATPSFAPSPSTFAPMPFSPSTFDPSGQQAVVRIPGPTPAPEDVVVTARRSTGHSFSPRPAPTPAPFSFAPESFQQQPRHQPHQAQARQAQAHQAQAHQAQAHQVQAHQVQAHQVQAHQGPKTFNTGQNFQGSRQRSTPVPIVALKFNLREDGSYSTSSETGDGTVRQEHGQFNGAGMAVKGMYAYRDLDMGPVQVSYVADEYGFQPQGPNIHPAIMMAVAEQVQNARSSKSRQGAAGLNGIQEEDYDDGSFTPRPKSRAVRRVVVRRLKK